MLNSNKLVCKYTYKGETESIEITYNGDEPTKIKLKTSNGELNETIIVKDGIGYDSKGDEYASGEFLDEIMNLNKQAAKANLKDLIVNKRLLK